MTSTQNLSAFEQPSIRLWLPTSLLGIYGTLSVFLVALGIWLALDLQQGYKKVLEDTSYRAMQQSQIISQSFRTQMMATDYVLRDVLGRVQQKDITYPDSDPDHAQHMTQLLKEKSATVVDFFLIIFNRNCVFTATETGKHLGASSKQELCEARKLHSGSDALTNYIPGSKSASGRSVLMLSRHLASPAGNF